VTWFSNEEGKKGQVKVGQLADLIVPSRDYFACADSELADMTSDLTIVGGKVVFAAGGFSHLDENPLPPAMPDWSPVRVFGGYAAWQDATPMAARQSRASACSCACTCSIHGHDHMTAWSAKLPVADLKSFWGALGCACWAV
jgi:hypothetical protein